MHFAPHALARVAGKYPTRANAASAAARRRPRHRPRCRRRRPCRPCRHPRSRRRQAALRRRRRHAASPSTPAAPSPAPPTRARGAAGAAARDLLGRGDRARFRRRSRGEGMAALADRPLWSARRPRLGGGSLGQAASRLAEGPRLGRLDRLVRGAAAWRLARRGPRTRLRQRAAGDMGQRAGGGERLDQGASAEGAETPRAGRASRATAGPRRALRLWLDRLAARRGRRRRAEPALLSALFQRGGPSACAGGCRVSAASGC